MVHVRVKSSGVGVWGLDKALDDLGKQDENKVRVNLSAIQMIVSYCRMVLMS